MQLKDLLALSVGFIRPNEVLWELQCSTGWLNICELKYATLTEDTANQGSLLPATNLRMVDGWIPTFHSKMAQLLRPETQTLVILNCYVQMFVIREMLRVLILDGNRIEQVELFETNERFELEFLALENNQLSDLSFVRNLSKLNSLTVSKNKLKVLEMNWFNDLKRLEFLNLESNQIKTLMTSETQSLQVNHFLLEDNLLTEFDIKKLRAPKLSMLSMRKNRLQSINTVQLGRSFPKLSSIDYDENPWNCGRLESLQFYLNTHYIMNFSQKIVQCHDRGYLNTVALKLPELIDLSEEKLDKLDTTTQQLIDGRGEKLEITKLESRVGRTKGTLRKMNEALAKLKQKYDLLKSNVKWFDFYEKLSW